MVSIEQAQALVGEFHRKNQLTDRVLLEDCEIPRGHRSEFAMLFTLMSETLKTKSKQSLELFIKTKDVRLLRAHLLLEELAELFDAMYDKDETALLDALADLFYVLLGTADIFDMPLGEAFIEVHSSNMSKERQPNDPHGERVRDKGPNYRAADFERVLREYRTRI